MTSAARVLVVDDEPAIRALVAKIVERAGLLVDTACNGAEAVAKMGANDYAVVVVDLMMPVLDGFGVVDYVRAMHRVRPAVIVISAGDSSVLRQLDGSVVHSILRKPFDIDVLGDLIVAAARGIREESHRQSDGSVVQFPRHTR